jgi:hypothetical protein
MPAHNPTLRALYAEKGNRGRWQPGSDTTDLEREIKALRAEDVLRRLVNDAPPLTTAQRDRLAVILRSGRTPDDGEAASP